VEGAADAAGEKQTGSGNSTSSTAGTKAAKKS
jgi:hypothetical protein